MIYRNQIDGLRTVAVLSVIFYHAGIKFVSGGFVGVDIFFVISGYLITISIFSDLDNKKFNIFKFYERRLRRIFPALLFMLVTSLMLLYQFIPNAEKSEYLISMTYASLFISNFFFWKDNDYFSIASEYKPLLNTWSLSCEMQFYIIYPIFIRIISMFGFVPAILSSLRRRFCISFIAVFLLSLSMAVVMANLSPIMNYYLLPTRLWEFMIGSLLVFPTKLKSLFPQKARDCLTFTGLILIIYPVFLYEKDISYPGLYTLLPVMGAAVIIFFSDSTTFIGKILSNKYISQLGLVSYGAYLWHYPIFVFIRYKSLNYPDVWQFLISIIITYIIAYISWKYIEIPFRYATTLKSRYLFYSIAFSIISFFCITNYAKIVSIKENIANIYPLHFKNERKKFEGLLKDSTNCSGRSPMAACFLNNVDFSKTIIIAGDSHARVFTEPLAKKMIDSKIRLVDFTASNCPFLLGLNLYINGNKQEYCNDQYQNARLNALRNLSPSIVVFFSRLPLYVNGSGFSNEIGGVELRPSIFLSQSPINDINLREKEMLISFLGTIQAVQDLGHRVVVIGPVPAIGWSPIDRLYKIQKIFPRASYHEIDELMKIPVDKVIKWNAYSSKIIELAMQKFQDIIYINTQSIFCDTNYCYPTKDGFTLYTDNNHLSLEGNEMLLEIFLHTINSNIKINDMYR